MPYQVSLYLSIPVRRDTSGKRAVFGADYLVLKDGGSEYEYARFPISDGEEFSVGFIHSVNQSPLIDFYEIRDHSMTDVIGVALVGLSITWQIFYKYLIQLVIPSR